MPLDQMFARYIIGHTFVGIYRCTPLHGGEYNKDGDMYESDESNDGKSNQISDFFNKMKYKPKGNMKGTPVSKSSIFE